MKHLHNVVFVLCAMLWSVVFAPVSSAYSPVEGRGQFWGYMIINVLIALGVKGTFSYVPAGSFRGVFKSILITLASTVVFIALEAIYYAKYYF